jgi:hypothetical protein
VITLSGCGIQSVPLVIARKWIFTSHEYGLCVDLC